MRKTNFDLMDEQQLLSSLSNNPEEALEELQEKRQELERRLSIERQSDLAYKEEHADVDMVFNKDADALEQQLRIVDKATRLLRSNGENERERLMQFFRVVNGNNSDSSSDDKTNTEQPAFKNK